MMQKNQTNLDSVIKCGPITDLEQFEEIKKYLKEFELDDRDISAEQFLAISNNKQLIGFGRIREHLSCSEMCSLGILPHERSKGYGKELVLALIEKAQQTIFLVCIIPEYFLPFGFSIILSYPDEIKEKLSYCEESLSVQKKYTVMKKVPSPSS